jgi:hypothetical protein
MTKLPLSKQLIFVAIVGGVAFVVSALLGMLAAAAGPNAEHTTSPWFIGMIFGVVAGTIYLALAGNRKVALAGDADRARALAGPQTGEAQLLVVREGFVGKLAGVDVLVDGAPATQLKSPRFAALSVAPGRHEVVATVQGKPTEPLILTLEAGEAAVIRIDMAIGRAKLAREPDVVEARRRLATIPMVGSVAA